MPSSLTYGGLQTATLTLVPCSQRLELPEHLHGSKTKEKCDGYSSSSMFMRRQSQWGSNANRLDEQQRCMSSEFRGNVMGQCSIVKEHRPTALAPSSSSTEGLGLVAPFSSCSCLTRNLTPKAIPVKVSSMYTHFPLQFRGLHCSAMVENPAWHIKQQQGRNVGTHRSR